MVQERSMIASQEEMKANRVPLGYRDSCAHLLIPLNQCRLREFYLPWKCEDERHAYEKCQYANFKERVKAFKEAEKKEAVFKEEQ